MVSNSLVNSFAPCRDCLLSTHAKKGKPYLTYLSALAKLLLQRQHTKKEEGERSKLPNGLNCKHQATSS